MHGTIKVRKIGNSLGIVIPQFVVQELKIKVGHSLRMTYYENNIKLTLGPTAREQYDAYIAMVLRENQELIDRTTLR